MVIMVIGVVLEALVVMVAMVVMAARLVASVVTISGSAVGASLITGPFVSGHLYVTLQFFFICLWLASRKGGLTTVF